MVFSCMVHHPRREVVKGDNGQRRGNGRSFNSPNVLNTASKGSVSMSSSATEDFITAEVRSDNSINRRASMTKSDV